MNSLPKDIGSKVNVIAQLELELANNNVTAHHVSHYTTGPLHGMWVWDQLRTFLLLLLLLHTVPHCLKNTDTS